MNEGGPISEFFYNLVPGSLFLFFLNILTNEKLINPLIKSGHEALLISFYIIGGLSIGFFFQCLTKIARKQGNKWAFKEVLKKKENKNEAIKINNELGMQGDKIFFYMDNAIRGISPAFLPTHFSSRFSFWANISWGSFFLAVASLSLANYILFAILFLFLIFSIWMAKLHLYNYYDTVFKTYYMTHVHKKTDNI